MADDLSTPSFVHVGGHRLAYHRSGEGPPVALIHGIPTFSYLWRKVIPLLVQASFSVLAIDLLGYGDSDKPKCADLGIATQAELIAAAFHKLEWSCGTLVGHDIGGGIAQLMCANCPTDAERLVLIDCIAYDSFPEPSIARLREPAWEGILGAPDFDLKKGLSKGFTRGMAHSDRITPEMIAAYERPFLGVEGRLAYLRAARALRTEELSARMEEIEKLDIPTLIVWGANDVFQPYQYGVRLAAAMPNARFERLEDGGHFLPEDEPEELTRYIADFIRSI